MLFRCCFIRTKSVLDYRIFIVLIILHIIQVFYIIHHDIILQLQSRNTRSINNNYYYYCYWDFSLETPRFSFFFFRFSRIHGNLFLPYSNLVNLISKSACIFFFIFCRLQDNPERYFTNEKILWAYLVSTEIKHTDFLYKISKSTCVIVLLKR